MIVMSLVACLMSNPAHCQEFHPFRQSTGLMECVVASQQAAAQWASGHPQWLVKQIKCTIGNPGLHA